VLSFSCSYASTNPELCHDGARRDLTAFRRGIAIAFDYRDRHGKATRRSAEPHGLLVQPPIWYVLAIDVEKKMLRMFRMDRISRPTLIKGHPFVPKQDVVEEILREIGAGATG